MRILVTGVAGFLGSHLAEHLKNEGHEVFGLDNLSIGDIGNVPKGIRFAKMDMKDAQDMQEIVYESKPEVIFHLAAWAHEGLSQFAPRLITENNYNAFLNMIVPAIRVGTRRVVVFSSMSVYGDQTPPFNEEMKRKPVDIYAVAKTAMEEAIEILADVHDFEYTIVRPHNVYGPKQSLRDPYRNVVGIFCNRILKDQAPIIYGDGEQTRSFTYIDDVTPYVAKLATLPDAKNAIFNIGPTEEYSINTLAKTVLAAFGRTDLAPIHVEDRPREVKEAFCTNDKAEKVLGYKTSVTLEEGIAKTVEWAKQQGGKEFEYLNTLELGGDKLPSTWKNKSI